jgi:hypothetical protein
MANQLILPPQKFVYKQITDQFPQTGNPRKKVFFQAELRSLANGDATFGIVAYPAWRVANKWVVGEKVSGTDTGAPPKIEPFTEPLAFANNEVFLSLSLSTKDRKKKKKKNPKKGRWSALMKMARKACKDPKSAETATLLFETKISENPHLEYSVTLDIEGTLVKVNTKPSPPAPPEE